MLFAPSSLQVKNVSLTKVTSTLPKVAQLRSGRLGPEPTSDSKCMLFLQQHMAHTLLVSPLGFPGSVWLLLNP